MCPISNQVYYVCEPGMSSLVSTADDYLEGGWTDVSDVEEEEVEVRLCQSFGERM